jgi:type IV pilus assembly protein PilA
MRRQVGFTLVELMVVIAILGILGASAVPVFQTYRQRTYGSEASLTIKNLLEAEIIYYLDHNKFFPENGQVLTIYPEDKQNDADVLAVREKLNITIPVGHNLEYSFYPDGQNSENGVQIQIHATFPLFKNGNKHLIGNVDKRGNTRIF